jgi:multidrug efflux system membrane fusion protein
MADGSNLHVTRTLASPPSRAKTWPWLLAALLVLGAGAAVYWFFRGDIGQSAAGDKMAAAGGHATPVVVATARRGQMGLYLVGLGAVDPFYTVTIHTRVDGQIMKVDFHEGQMVKKGDPLFEIDSRPYDAAFLQAQGELDKDQAELVNAKLNVQRDTDAGTAISAQQLSTDTATEQQTEGAIKVDQAAINSAQLNVTYSHITSPIDGRIGLRLVDEGNIVHAADTAGMAVITQLQPIAVVFSLPEDDIPRVLQSMKQNPNLPVEAYDRDSKTPIASGKLLTIDNEVDPTSGTFKCKAEFDNKAQTLFPSQFVNVRMLVDTRSNAVIVPAAAVQQGPDSTFVYVVQPDNTVQLRPVTVTQLGGNEILVAPGRQAGAGEQACVESGLAPGDIVVTDGVDKLVQGAKVQVSKSPMGMRHGATTQSAGGAGASGEHGMDGAAGEERANPDTAAAASSGWQHQHRPSSAPVDEAADPSTGDGAAPHGPGRSQD